MVDYLLSHCWRTTSCRIGSRAHGGHRGGQCQRRDPGRCPASRRGERVAFGDAGYRLDEHRRRPAAKPALLASGSPIDRRRPKRRSLPTSAPWRQVCASRIGSARRSTAARSTTVGARRAVVAPNGGRSAAGGAFLRLDAMRW